MLHSALAYAVRLQLIMTNPANGVTAPRIATKEMAALTPEQARAVLRASAAEGIRWQAFFTATITTGLQLGELLGLRWKDVDFDARLLRVCQIAQVVRGQGTLIKAPKTPAASRTIALGSHVVALLHKHHVEQDATRLALGAEWHDLDLVFPNIFGRPMVDETLRKTFHRILERAGVPHIRFHDLQHTAATLMLSGGIHPKAVSERLGHTSISLTLNTYSHVQPAMQEAAAQKLDVLLGLGSYA